jgi:hypothetical protein
MPVGETGRVVVGRLRYKVAALLLLLLLCLFLLSRFIFDDLNFLGGFCFNDTGAARGRIGGVIAPLGGRRPSNSPQRRHR